MNMAIEFLLSARNNLTNKCEYFYRLGKGGGEVEMVDENGLDIAHVCMRGVDGHRIPRRNCTKQQANYIGVLPLPHPPKKEKK